jgi:hypothetical protein
VRPLISFVGGKEKGRTETDLRQFPKTGAKAGETCDMEGWAFCGWNGRVNTSEWEKIAAVGKRDKAGRRSGRNLRRAIRHHCN